MSKQKIIQYGEYNNNGNIERIFVSDTQQIHKNKILCELCKSILIPKKCDNVKRTSHYAHKPEDGGRDCDSWSPIFKKEYDHNWHLMWQDFFKINNYGILEKVIEREIDGKKIRHRADIITNTEYIIEIQHSNISQEDINKRESFYGDKLIWIIDGRNNNFKFLFKTDDYYFGRYYLDFIYSFKKPVFIDTNYGLFELLKVNHDRICVVQKVNSKLKTNCKKLTKCFNNENKKEIYKQLINYLKNNAYNKYNFEYIDISNILSETINCKYDLKTDIFTSNFYYNNLIKIDYKHTGIYYFRDLNKQSYDIQKYIINKNGLLLEFIENQTEELCIDAIKNNIYSFKYIKNKTNTINKTILNIDGNMIQYIFNQTKELCNIAINQNINSFKFIKNKTYELNKQILNKNGLLLEFIENQTEELCFIAIKNNINAYNFVKDKTYDIDHYFLNNNNIKIFELYKNIELYEILKNILNKNGLLLEFIENQTEELCIIAIKNNINAYNFVKHKTYEIDKSILKIQNNLVINNEIYEILKNILNKNGLLLEFIENQTEELCIIAIKNNINAYTFVKNKTYEINKILLNIDGNMLQYIENQTDELCIIAIKNNINAYTFVKKITYNLYKSILIEHNILSTNNIKIYELFKNILNKNGLLLEFIENQTEELCIIAVKNNIDAYNFIINKTYELDKKLLDINFNILKYIENQTEELCLIALKNNIDSFKHIKNKTYNLNKNILNIDGNMLKYIENQTEELCLIALKNDLKSYNYIQNKTDEINKIYNKIHDDNIYYEKYYKKISNNGMYLKYITEQTENICLLAIDNNVASYEYVKNMTPNIAIAIVKKDGMLLNKIDEIFHTNDICIAALKNNINAYQFIKNKTYEINAYVLSKKGWLLKFIENQTDELCIIAVQNDGMALEFVKNKTKEICDMAIKSNINAKKFI